MKVSTLTNFLKNRIASCEKSTISLRKIKEENRLLDLKIEELSHTKHLKGGKGR